MSHLYVVESSNPARFRARGLDAAHRVSRRVQEAVRVALEADPEVLDVEEQMFFREGTQPCDGTSRCRAPLHYKGCKA